jgi:hypothetical protein
LWKDASSSSPLFCLFSSPLLSSFSISLHVRCRAFARPVWCANKQATYDDVCPSLYDTSQTYIHFSLLRQSICSGTCRLLGVCSNAHPLSLARLQHQRHDRSRLIEAGGTETGAAHRSPSTGESKPSSHTESSTASRRRAIGAELPLQQRHVLGQRAAACVLHWQ